MNIHCIWSIQSQLQSFHISRNVHRCLRGELLWLWLQLLWLACLSRMGQRASKSQKSLSSGDYAATHSHMFTCVYARKTLVMTAMIHSNTVHIKRYTSWSLYVKDQSIRLARHRLLGQPEVKTKMIKPYKTVTVQNIAFLSDLWEDILALYICTLELLHCYKLTHMQKPVFWCILYVWRCLTYTMFTMLDHRVALCVHCATHDLSSPAALRSPAVLEDLAESEWRQLSDVNFHRQCYLNISKHHLFLSCEKEPKLRKFMMCQYFLRCWNARTLVEPVAVRVPIGQ